MQRVLSHAAERLAPDVDYALAAWYAYSGEERSPLSEAILVDTCSRFVFPVSRDPSGWRQLHRTFAELGLSGLDEAVFDRLYAAPDARAAA